MSSLFYSNIKVEKLHQFQWKDIGWIDLPMITLELSTSVLETRVKVVPQVSQRLIAVVSITHRHHRTVGTMEIITRVVVRMKINYNARKVLMVRCAVAAEIVTPTTQ
jgi:hypothetical protein